MARLYRRLPGEVFPELEAVLADDLAAVAAAHLGATAEALAQALGGGRRRAPAAAARLRAAFVGGPETGPVVAALAAAARTEPLRGLLAAGRADAAAFALRGRRDRATPTGRVLGGLADGEGVRAVVLDLAEDARRAARFALAAAGDAGVALAGDELIVEVAEAEAGPAAAALAARARAAAAGVLGGLAPPCPCGPLPTREPPPEW